MWAGFMFSSQSALFIILGWTDITQHAFFAGTESQIVEFCFIQCYSMVRVAGFIIRSNEWVILPKTDRANIPAVFAW